MGLAREKKKKQNYFFINQVKVIRRIMLTIVKKPVGINQLTDTLVIVVVDNLAQTMHLFYFLLA
jgi:hypothetical protein